MQKEGISKPVSFKCFNCNHQEIAWKDETGMIRFVCPHCGTITISKEKSRRHTKKYAFELNDGYCIETVSITRKTGTTVR